MGGLAAALAAEAPTLHNYAQIFAFSRSTRRSAGRRPSRRSRSGRDSATLVCTTAALLALLLGTFLAYSISRFASAASYFRTRS